MASVPSVERGSSAGPIRQILTGLALMFGCATFLALSHGDGWVSLFCLVAAIACFTPMVKFVMQEKTENRAREQTQLLIAQDTAEKEVAMFQRVSDISQLPNLTKYASEIILGSEERCVALSKNARHIVSHKRTKIVGRTAGVSYKVSKNMRVRLGGFQGEPRTTIYDEEADTGTVYVTDQRFIFGGAKEVVTVPIAKISSVAVEGDNDIVQVLIENRAEPLTVRITEQFRAPVIAAAAERMVRQTLDHKVPGKHG